MTLGRLVRRGFGAILVLALAARFADYLRLTRLSRTGSSRCRDCNLSALRLGICLLWFRHPCPNRPAGVLGFAWPQPLCRNLTCIGVLAIVLGEGAMFRSRQVLIYAACLALAFHLFVVLYEELALKRQLGESYDADRRTVPCWIPRFR